MATTVESVDGRVVDEQRADVEQQIGDFGRGDEFTTIQLTQIAIDDRKRFGDDVSFEGIHCLGKLAEGRANSITRK